MLPRVYLRVKRVVRLWTHPEECAVTGRETEASWQRMIDRSRRRETEAERRMTEIERELNRLGID